MRSRLLKTRPTRYARFAVDGRIVYGVVEDQSVREIDGDLFGAWTSTDRVHALDDVQLLVPTEAGKVIALAGNYRDHLGDRPAPSFPNPSSSCPRRCCRIWATSFSRQITLPFITRRKSSL